MTRRGGSTREHAREELRYYGDEAHRWYDWLVERSGGRARFKSRVLPGIAVALVLVLGLTAWAVTPKSGKHEDDDGGFAAAASTSAASASPAGPAMAAASAPAVAPGGPPARPRAQPARTNGPWPTGMSAGNSGQANTFASYRGRPNDVVVMFTARDSWGSITGPWIGDSANHFSSFPGTWVVSVPMFPEPPSGTNVDTWNQQRMAECASGAFDVQFRKFGNWLNRQGRSDSFVRIGWEFNGKWFAWKAANPQQWVQCFRHEALALISVAPRVRIDWTINARTTLPNGGDPFSAYPGDDVVDVIGIDTYDQYPPSYDTGSFNAKCEDGPLLPGPCYVINFAQLHNKLFSVPEWGLVDKGTPAGQAGQAGGDNPFYIQQMARLFRQYRGMLAYEAYFNDSDPRNVNSSLTNPVQQPNGSAAYRSLWSASQ
ncbi:glycosyl hydrolase [Pseudofrankia sp. BMG5.36]|uniref:glycoside hydrolase family 26 protein n=1 Tax=Pseudofrankia sp. BMG5.36 TaxID=1834512 RepID=UPI0008DA975E|nr:glycosyl hydrolase [Pseudofrankia sp. BMG5.36]OHV48043.1 hypothetical protein BCD48_16415 [Pseudofrankia sp. BMG5.36]